MIAISEYTISKIYDGDKGDSVIRVVPEYITSTSSSAIIPTPTDDDWSEEKPTDIDSTHYLWTRQRTDLSSGGHEYSDAVCDIIISGIISDVNTNTQSITNKVWESDITSSINQYDGSTVSSIRDRVSTTETNISGITTRVSDVESTTTDLGTRLSTAESSITQNAGNIALKVSQDGVISAINQSAEQITIDANKVDLVGNVTFNMLDSSTQNTITSATPELIVGTHGTTATASWTGTSTKLSSIQSGTRIQYKMTSAGASNVTLNLTLNDGTTTGAIPVYYNNTTRLGTQYGINAVLDLIYDGSVWRITNPYTNNNTVGSYGATSLVAGTGTIRQYSLIMMTVNNTWSSFTTTSGTDTNKTKNTNGFILSDLYYMSSSSNYAAGKKCSTCYESYSINFCYSANCGSTLTAGKKVYIVGEINSNDGLFYLDDTWWTQTEPTTADGKTYIYVGIASNTTSVYLSTKNPAYQFYNGEFLTLEEIDTIKAQVDADTANLWIVQSGQLAKDIIDNWATDATSSTTTIKGGLIQTHTITSNQLATNAIMSSNYQAGTTGSPYSTFGTFLDLSNGNFYTPNFGVQSTGSTGAYINGEIIATSGRIGDDETTAWDIGTYTDYEANDHGSIIGHGDAFIQAGKWMISQNKIDTRWYDNNNNKITYIYNNSNSTYYDYGLSVPLLNSTDTGYVNSTVSENFLYIRSHASTIPVLESDWEYSFRVDKSGVVYASNLYINGKSIASMISDGVDGGAYLPSSGGTVTGNVTITGTLTATASKANQLTHSISINGKSFDGSSNVTVGAIGASYGGTGKTSLIDSANVLLNALSTGSSTPTDNDYYISQYVGGGTTTTTYHRRPMSAMWIWIKSKIGNDHSNLDSYYVLKSGDTITGSLTVQSDLTADSGSFGEVTVDGTATFTSGINGDLVGDVTGDLTGNATSADKISVTRSFTIGNTSKDVDWSAAVSYSKSEISGVAAPASSDTTVTANAGWMSGADKYKLDNIAAGAQVNTITGVKGGSESSYRTGNVNITATNIGLGNVTNNKQVKGLSSGTTSGHLVTWGSDGYTVSDSGIAKGSIATKLTLSGTDYSTSSNAIVVTKSNLQSAVQDTNLLLMTAAERSKLASIQVSEGGTIDFSGVTASAPITATVATDKTVNITHDNSGVTAGTYRSVTVNKYGHVTGGTNPTTLSGYGITDAKIASGVITLGSNTITPLTSSSTLDATKLSGTASISTTGNATTATKFNSNRTITLTGDTTGSASTDGSSGWSITTSTIYLSGINDSGAAQSYATNRPTTANINYHDNKLRYYLATSSMTIGKPSADAHILHMPWDNDGWDVQLAVTHNPSIQIRHEDGSGNWGDWITALDSNNYTTYTVKKDGTGATGTWGINISGAANYSYFPKIVNANEIRFDSSTKPSSATTLCVGYKWSDGSSDAKINKYNFYNGGTGLAEICASSVIASTIFANNGNSGTTGGLVLYGSSPTGYGIAMRNTSNGGKHGYVQSDWAIYSYMTGNSADIANSRGWILKNANTDKCVASVSGLGQAVFNGSVTLGTTGNTVADCVSLEYDNSLKCLNFVFN